MSVLEQGPLLRVEDLMCKLDQNCPYNGFRRVNQLEDQTRLISLGGHLRMLEQTVVQAHHWRHNVQPC